MAKQFNFEAKLAALRNAKSRIPDLIGGIALKHYQKSFRDGGFTDETLDPWKKRKSRNRSDKNNPKKDRAILVDSGVLKNSGKVKSANWNRVVVGFYGTEYGSFHNRGKGNNPKRQFIGKSAVVTRNIATEINKHLKKILSS